MSIQIEYENVGLAEADHRIANNLASLSSVIRFQRNAISKSGRTFTTEQVCMLLDDIDARIEVTAKLHKSLAQAVNGNGVNLGDFLEEISGMISTLSPDGRMDLTVDNACGGYIDPRHALHAGLITAELLTNASKYAHPTGLVVKVNVRCETNADGSFMVEVTDDGVGFPENFDPASDGGMGFQLMRALANGLNAKLQFEHDSLGVCARLVSRVGIDRRSNREPDRMEVDRPIGRNTYQRTGARSAAMLQSSLPNGQSKMQLNRKRPVGVALKVTQLFPGRMNSKQCHQQFLECCRRAGSDGLEPGVKGQWIELAEVWRFLERQVETVELARPQK